MNAFLKWLVGIVIDKLLAAVGAVIAAGRRDQANVDKGAAQAKAEGLQQESAALKKTQDAINHARLDKEFKNTEFRD